MGLRMLECGSPSDWSVGMAMHAPVDPNEIAYYTCSMHPSVRQASPGLCPLCGMTLTPVTRQDAESGAVFVDDARRQRIGVRTAATERRVLSRRIRAVGEVRADETRLADVTLRTSGWVQNLAVAATGQRVRAGQVLFTLYSPELYAAQREHLATARNRGVSETFATLSRASRQRLRLLGMTEAQIDELEQRGEAGENVPILSPASGWVLEKDIVEGARIESGTRVYRIAGLDRIWIDAEVYEADLPHVQTGQRVQVVLSNLPDRTLEARIDFIYPELQTTSRTARVRVVLDNPDLDLRPGMYASVEIDVDLGERLAIPTAAVIYTGPRRLVFVDLGEGRFRPQEVTLGVDAGGWSEVVSGLQPGDIVVTSGNFLIAAESRIRSSTEALESGHGSH
jgi:Cu(I)/Ag(I) efflux system membrane fusion protein